MELFKKITVMLAACSVPVMAAVSPQAPAVRSNLEHLQGIQANVVTVSTPAIEVNFVSSSSVRSYTVTDFWGELVDSGEIPAGTGKLQLPVFEPGSYLFRISDGGECRFAVVGEIPPLPKKRSLYGSTSHFGHLTWPHGIRTLLRAAGISELRDSASWNQSEREKGVLDVNNPVPRITRKTVENFRVMLIAAYGNRHYDRFSSPHTPEGVAAWKRYLTWLIDTFPESDEIEIWNEFNAAFLLHGVVAPTPENYLTLLKASYEAVKTKSQSVKVVGCSTSLVPRGWYDSFFKLGGLNYLDVVSVHPYRWTEWACPPETLYPDMVWLRKRIDQYAGGRKIPIYADEFGYPVGRDTGVSPEMQAAYIPRTYGNFARAGVERAHWYNFILREQDQKKFPWYLAFLTKTNRFLPEPGFSAFAAMTRAVDGAELIGEVAGLAPGLGLKYQRDGKEVYQLWGTGKPVVLEVAATGPVKVTDLMGRTRELLPLDGRIYLLLNTTTVYLSGPVQSVSTSKEVVLREKTPAFFRIPMTLEFQAPADFRLKLRNGEFQPGQVRLPVSEKVGGAAVSGELRRAGRLCGLLFFQFEVTPQLESEALRLDAEGNLVLRLKNRFPEARQALSKIRGTIAGQEFSAAPEMKLPAKETAEVKIPLLPGPVVPYRLHDIKVIFEFSDHDPVEVTDRIGYNPCHYMPQEDFRKDGELDEWKKFPAINLKKHARQICDVYGKHVFPGAAEVGGKIWIAWNEKYLFIAAELDDEIHHQKFPLWQGDSIQIGLAPVKVDPMTTIELETGWRSSVGDSILVPSSIPPGFDGGAVRTRSSYKFFHADRKTRYEIAMPWETLFFIRPEVGGLFRLSFLVNDNNGTDQRQGALAWGDGIVTTKSSRLYSVIQFEKRDAGRK